MFAKVRTAAAACPHLSTFVGCTSQSIGSGTRGTPLFAGPRVTTACVALGHSAPSFMFGILRPAELGIFLEPVAKCGTYEIHAHLSIQQLHIRV